MADPFATALGALFRAPGSVAATYTPAVAGAAIPIRIIFAQGTAEIAYGQGHILADAMHVQMRRSDVADPQSGDVVVIDGEEHLISGGAVLDTEGLTWRCELRPAK